MSIWTPKASKGNGDGFPKAPAGNHPAVLVAIVDLGTQKQEYQGNVTWQRRAYFCWELTAEAVPGFKDKNFLVGLDLNISLNEKAKLRKWIEARVGKQIPEGVEYDIRKELGQKCLLNVAEKNGYPKVEGMGAVPKGMAVPDAKTPPFLFSLDERKPDGSFELPDWLPWLYGSKLGDVILECKEIANPDATGGGVTEAGRKAAEENAKAEADLADKIPW